MRVPKDLLSATAGGGKQLSILAMLVIAIASLGGVLWGITKFGPIEGANVSGSSQPVNQFPPVSKDPCPGCGRG